jgi:hypothetical protein
LEEIFFVKKKASYLCRTDARNGVLSGLGNRLAPLAVGSEPESA